MSSRPTWSAVSALLHAPREGLAGGELGGKRRSKGLRGFAATALLFCLLAPNSRSFSQSTFASLKGIVRDQSGAVISGATIVLTSRDTGVEQITETGPAGVYSLGDIPPGNHFAQASKAGFTTEKKTDLILQVNQSATLDFTLTVGIHKETVMVASNLSVVDSTTSELGTVIMTDLVPICPSMDETLLSFLT